MTYASFPTPPKPKVPSPVTPNFPLPSTPVVDELILLGLGEAPKRFVLVALPIGCEGGRVAERKEVGFEGTDAGMSSSLAGGDRRERGGACRPLERDRRSVFDQPVRTVEEGDPSSKRKPRHRQIGWQT